MITNVRLMVVNNTMKYYAVVSGRTPGIYTDWPTTESMVKGYPGAIYKGFRSRQEAEAFIQSSTAGITATQHQQPHTLPLIGKTIIYTDGSFADNACGFGIVILTSNNDKLTAYGRVPLDPTNNVAELYAIYVALSLVKGDVVLHTDSRYAISCLTTYVHDWIKNGWNGVANRNVIEGAFAQMQERNVSFQYVPAHTGIELNEEADRLANTGRMGTESLIVCRNGTRINI